MLGSSPVAIDSSSGLRGSASDARTRSAAHRTESDPGTPSLPCAFGRTRSVRRGRRRSPRTTVDRRHRDRVLRRTRNAAELPLGIFGSAFWAQPKLGRQRRMVHAGFLPRSAQAARTRRVRQRALRVLKPGSIAGLGRERPGGAAPLREIVVEFDRRWRSRLRSFAGLRLGDSLRPAVPRCARAAPRRQSVHTARPLNTEQLGMITLTKSYRLSARVLVRLH
jgi:hypothetical protein